MAGRPDGVEVPRLTEGSGGCVDLGPLADAAPASAYEPDDGLLTFADAGAFLHFEVWVRDAIRSISTYLAVNKIF